MGLRSERQLMAKLLNLSEILKWEMSTFKMNLKSKNRYQN